MNYEEGNVNKKAVINLINNIKDKNENGLTFKDINFIINLNKGLDCECKNK